MATVVAAAAVTGEGAAAEAVTVAAEAVTVAGAVVVVTAVAIVVVVVAAALVTATMQQGPLATTEVVAAALVVPRLATGLALAAATTTLRADPAAIGEWCVALGWWGKFTTPTYDLNRARCRCQTNRPAVDAIPPTGAVCLRYPLPRSQHA